MDQDTNFTLGSDYTDIRPFGQGGLGELFAAHKKGLDVDVVIKRTKSQFEGTLVQTRESDILKNLKHQFLPRIYDIIFGSDGYLYTVMDLIPGMNLKSYVQKYGAVPQNKAHKWASQLCEVTSYLHQQNPPIIHCDIKPGNIMITPEENICLIDFNASFVMYRQNMSFASPGFAAPEQYNQDSSAVMFKPGMSAERKYAGSEPGDKTEILLQGDQLSGVSGVSVSGSGSKSAEISFMSSNISKATDVYAIGATLYFMLTGRAPEKSTGSVTPISEAGPAINQYMTSIVLRAMQKDPSRRFCDAASMLQALSSVDVMDERYRGFSLRRKLVTALIICSYAISILLMAEGVSLIHRECISTYLNLVTSGENSARTGDFQGADEDYQKAMNMMPARIEAYSGQAVALYEAQEYEAACNVITNALNGGKADVKAAKPEDVSYMYYIEGSCLYELEKYEDAINAFKTALKDPDADVSWYRSLAVAQAKDGKLDAAEKTMKMLHDRGADNADIDAVQAEIKEMQGDTEGALKLYEKVFGESDDMQLLSHAYIGAAQIYDAEDDLDGETQVLEKSIKKLGDGSFLQSGMLAQAYIKMAQEASDDASAHENYAKAEKVLRGLKNSGHDTIVTDLNLAFTMQQNGEYKDAEKVLLKLQDMYPTDYRTDMRLALLYADWQASLDAKTRDYTKMESCYESAEKKYSNSSSNGGEDSDMEMLRNLISQLKDAGWIK